MRIRIGAILLFASGLLLTSGCFQMPKPVSTTEPQPEPAWTLTQARTVRQEVDAQYHNGIWSDDADVAVKRVTGQERTATLGDIATAKLYRTDTTARSWRSGTAIATWTTTRTRYPQTAFVLIKLDKKLEWGPTQLLEVYTRAGAGATWVRSATVPLLSKNSWPSNGSLVTAAAARVNGLDTLRVPQLVSALNRPTKRRDAGFTQNRNFTWARQYLRDARQADGTGTSSVSYAVATDTMSFTTRDATYIVVPTTLRLVHNLKPGWVRTYKKPVAETYPGEYSGDSTTFAVTMLVKVPPRGRSTITDTYWTETEFRPF